MSLSVTYRLEIPDALMAALERAKTLRGVKQGMLAAGGYLVGLQAWYPPESHRPQPFVSERQRRYVMAMIRAGVIKVPYVRTGGLQRSMSMSVENDGLTVRTGTNLDRAKWTHGEEQARYHTVTGWRRTMDIAQRESGNVYMLVLQGARGDFE